MWYTPWEMHRKEEDLGEDCMEGGEGRSCGRQELRTSEGDIKIEENQYRGTETRLEPMAVDRGRRRKGY